MRRVGKPQRSLQQEYAAFIEERIEEFKQQISREELLRIADDAVRELDAGAEDQLLLTEVLMLDHVDRLIRQRLSLPTFRRWRARHVKLRRAQRGPTHWGLDGRSPIVALAERGDLDGAALVVGTGVAPVALYLAACDWPVVFVDAEVSIVEGLETRAAAESLSSRVEAYVVSLGCWLPEVQPVLTVIDPASLARVAPAEREQFLHALLERTPPGGVHCLMPATPGRDAITLGPETVKGYYTGWHLERIHDGSGRGLIATRPAAQAPGRDRPTETAADG